MQACNFATLVSSVCLLNLPPHFVSANEARGGQCTHDQPQVEASQVEVGTHTPFKHMYPRSARLCIMP